MYIISYCVSRLSDNSYLKYLRHSKVGTCIGVKVTGQCKASIVILVVMTPNGLIVVLVCVVFTVSAAISSYVVNEYLKINTDDSEMNSSLTPFTIALSGVLISLVLYVVFGQVTVEKLRKNLKSKI